MKQALAATALLFAGCGGETFETFCAELDQSPCAAQKACGLAASDAACADLTGSTRLSSSACGGPLEAAVKKGTVRYDGDEGRRCLDARTTQCDPKDACAKVFTGTVAPGGGCTVSEECGGEAWCDRSSTCPGVCAATVGEGATVPHFEACSTKRFELSGGQVTCLPSRAVGEACRENKECGFDLTCRDGRCAAAPREGAACDAAQCARGFRCVGGTCSAFVERGAACVDEATSMSGSSCRSGLSCRDGVCGDVLREGEACSRNPNRCAGGLRCSSDTCVEQGGPGAPCATSFDCGSAYFCDSGACDTKRAAGEACGSTDACQLDLSCLDGACAAPVCSP